MKTLTPHKIHRAFNGTVEFYTHQSYSTQTPMNFSVYRPIIEGRKRPPVLFWLSGLTCNEENFMQKAHALKKASELGIMLICPDTSPRGLNLIDEHTNDDFGSGASFYLNATTAGYCDHYRMQDYLVGELPQLIFDHFTVDFSKIGIFGHSMGGYGALILGLKFPELFKSLSAFSPICHPVKAAWGQKAFNGYLGADKNKWEEYDATIVLQRLGYSRPILIDQGLEDEYLETQLMPTEFIKVAQSKNIDLRFNLREHFDHSYYFVSSFISQHLEFHHAQLNSV